MEGRANPGLAFHPKLAVLALQDAQGYRQSEAFPGRRLGIEPMEDFKNLGLVFRGNTDAGILDDI